MATTKQFSDALDVVLAEATATGLRRVVVKARDLHRRVGGYPGPDHRMPMCCSAMRSAMDVAHGDRLVSAPPKGNGASLTIDYVLPRPNRLAGVAEGTPSALGAEPSALATTEVSRAPHIHPEFLTAVEALHGKFETLSHMAAVKPGALPPNAPQKGIYLFSDGARPMYVGRTKNLKRRIVNHCGNGSRENQAVFAFKLARETTGKPKAAYTTDGSRAALMKDPAFAASFTEAKKRVRRMDLRFVEEPDSLRQALLEMYVAVVLRTPYNDFDTH